MANLAKALDRIHKLLARHCLTANNVHPPNNPLPTTILHLDRMSINQPPIQQRLDGRKSPCPKRPVFRPRVTPILAVQGNFMAEDRQHHNPRRLNGQRASLRDGLPEGLERDIAAAHTADGSVAELRGVCLGDTVESVGQLVACVCADILGTGWAAVVEDLFGAETAGQLEVGGRAGGNGAEAGS